MKRITLQPVRAIAALLGACALDRVDFFVTETAGEKSICVYPTGDDRFATLHALEIIDATDPVVQAALIGLVHVHNQRFDGQTVTAADAFIRACIDDLSRTNGDSGAFEDDQDA